LSSFALIIEDDQDTALLFSHILEFIGFHTEIEIDPDRVFHHLDRTIPEIVLLDIMLGQNVSGTNILDFIKRQDRLNNCRVIVITGYPDLAETIKDKADLVLLKPISASQLSTMILRLVPNHISESFLYNASYDPVTGLMNLARFKDQINHTIQRSKRRVNLTFVLVLIQLKNLNHLQRENGELIANQFLYNIVSRIKAEIREIDSFSRVAKDKFAILLEDVKSIENAIKVTKRIQAVLDDPIYVRGRSFPFTGAIEIKEEDFVNQLDTFLGHTS
jgi:diguanylate cyclase (GGDEF)-like protein